MDKKKLIGSWGEGLAVKRMTESGYGLLEKNWRRKFGEIDLIFTKNQEIIFVEVKTRSSNYFGWAEEAVNQTKKKKIKRTINQFLLECPEFADFYPRFDIVAIEINSLIPNIIHYQNVEL